METQNAQVFVEISFEGAFDAPSPYVVLYNPLVMPRALLSQVLRFGLTGGTERHPQVTGHLKGSRKAFTEMIQSYGVGITIVPTSS